MRFQTSVRRVSDVGFGVCSKGSPTRVCRSSPMGKQIVNLSTVTNQELLKKQAAEKAVEYVSSGMVVGLGTGSTASYAVQRIGELLKSGQLKGIVGVPTSTRTFDLAKSLDIPLATLDEQPKLDVAIDGADEVDPALDVIKGRGGALLRERMVEAASDKFVCIVDETKMVGKLGVDSIPIEVVQFCYKYSQKRILEAFGGESACRAELRMEEDKPYVTDNGNFIIDLYVKSPLTDAGKAADVITAMEGIVDHGLFLGMVDTCIVAKSTGIEVLERPN